MNKKLIAFNITKKAFIGICAGNFGLYAGISLIPIWWVRVLVVLAISVWTLITGWKIVIEVDREVRASGCPWALVEENPRKYCGYIPSEQGDIDDVKFGDF